MDDTKSYTKIQYANLNGDHEGDQNRQNYEEQDPDRYEDVDHQLLAVRRETASLCFWYSLFTCTTCDGTVGELFLMSDSLVWGLPGNRSAPNVKAHTLFTEEKNLLDEISWHIENLNVFLSPTLNFPFQSVHYFSLIKNIVLSFRHNSARICHLIVSIDWLTMMINKLSLPTEGKTLLIMLENQNIPSYFNFR